MGVSKVERYEDLDEAIRKAAREDKKVIVEEGIRGQEMECAVLGNRDAQASIVGRLAPLPSFTTMTTSMSTAPASCTSPARLDQEVAEKIRRTLCGLTGCWAALA